MNIQRFSLFAGLISGLLLISTAQAGDFVANLNDPAWDGISVPEGEQCQKFGGNAPKTPALSISGIPTGSNLIILEFSDRNYQRMDNGGHGKIGYALSRQQNNVLIPSVSGHSFTLPEGFFIVAAHRSPKWDKAGAYMPPCSGGKGNAYYVTVKAVKQGGESSEVMAQHIIEMGRY